MDEVIQHFSHEHPLVFKEEHKNDDSSPVFCDGCEDQVLGPRYSCQSRDTCYGFNLHKSCAELPHEIHHPIIHRKHPLILTKRSPRCSCEVCKRNMKHCSFNYYCSRCDFDVHLKCASKWQDYCHDHKFTILSNLIDLTCEVCGEGDIDRSPFYLCSICQLVVHKHCTWLPSLAKLPRHQHPLMLTWCYEDFYPKDQFFCSICSIDMDKSRAVYYCHECSSFAAHNTCTTSYLQSHDTTIADDEHRPQTDNQIQLESDAQINHFSHQHLLTLIKNRNEVVKYYDHHDNTTTTCDGCMRPITNTDDAFYGCTEHKQEQKEFCHFFLHTTCARLPQKRLLQFHDHELTLLPRAASIDGVFKCCMCSNYSQGFGYHCDNIGRCFDSGVGLDFGLSFNFDVGLDLHCTILWVQKALKHEAHVHRLHFNRTSADDDNLCCRGCGTDCPPFWFSCRRCKFHLCIPCVKLPPTARHRYDHHPLELTYDSAKNELDEYYCEICEGKRDPKHWFYSCKDCDFDYHPRCVIGRHPEVKLGGSYEHQSHPHLVTLVDKKRSPILGDKRENILPCRVCRLPCEGLVFECPECKINIHRTCGRDISRLIV